MPLLAINLSDILFAQIKVLVERGLYSSYEAFLEIAAFNQLALERGATPAELIERGHRRSGVHESTPNVDIQLIETKNDLAAMSFKSTRTTTVRGEVEPVVRLAPPEEVRVTEEDYSIAFAHLALAASTEAIQPIASTADKLSQDRVFGQVNRLLPLKLACRWLVNAASDDGKWPRYEEISDRLADDAGTIGSLLERWDSENNRKRDELLSTGLPRRGNSASRDRFLSQFLARVTRSGEIYPATICQYQLARFDDSVIALTEQGLAFSQLQNPILDKKDKKAAATLTLEESSFLAKQIFRYVPIERDDMRILLRAILEGKTTPSDLAETIRDRFPLGWSESVFQTYTSGLVARLGELRFLKRVWVGRNVNYELGNRKLIDSFLKD